jgi:hypothetical protein
MTILSYPSVSGHFTGIRLAAALCGESKPRSTRNMLSPALNCFFMRPPVVRSIDMKRAEFPLQEPHEKRKCRGTRIPGPRDRARPESRI